MENPEIQETPTEPKATDAIPHAEGEVLEGSDGKEKIVYDRDEDGNVTGWHKETV